MRNEESGKLEILRSKEQIEQKPAPAGGSVREVNLGQRLYVRGVYFLMAALGYLGLALFYLRPMFAKFATAVPGGGDAWIFYWNFWWVRQALFIQQSNPFQTPYVYYPTGATLYFHTVAFLDSVAGASLVQGGFTLAAAYNIVNTATFVIAGLGMYLLATYTSGDRLAGFLAGAAFAFCPFHFAHMLGQLNISYYQWVPLFILYVLTTCREEKWRNAIFAAIFLAANTLTEWTYVVFLLSLGEKRGKKTT